MENASMPATGKPSLGICPDRGIRIVVLYLTAINLSFRNLGYGFSLSLIAALAGVLIHYQLLNLLVRK
jgi:hypothetical protein